jgi:PAS domain S-box-containing protein
MISELRCIVDALPGLVWTATLSGDIDFVNQRWCDYTGFTAEDARGHGLPATVHADDLASFTDSWTSMLDSGEPRDCEARLRRFDGIYRWFSFGCSPMLDATGRIVKWCGINTDIDDRKNAVDDVRPDESNFREIADCVPANVVVLSPSGKAENFNRHVLEYFGATVEELKSWTTGGFCHPEDLPGVVERLTRSLTTGETYTSEHRVRNADGVFRWFRMRGQPHRDSAGRITRWYIIQNDIDDQKRAEDALRASELKFRAIVDSIPGLVCTLDPAGRVLLINQRLFEYYGKTAEDLNVWEDNDTIHPADRDRVVASFAHSVATGLSFESEHRLRRADGVYQWFQVRALPVRDGDDRITGWYLLLTDIEDRKRAEDVIRASERDLIQIINTLPSTAWSTRPDGYCDFVNTRWLDYAGFTAEEARGWNWARALHPDDADALNEQWQSCLATGASLDAEARMRRFDGVYRWFLFRANPLRDESGTIVKWYGTNIDIDDRKRAEDELRRGETFLAEGQRLSSTGSFSWRVATGEVTLSEQLHRIFEFEQGEPVTLQHIGSIVHPEDIPLLTEKIAKGQAGGDCAEYEIRLQLPNGSMKYVRTLSVATRDSSGGLEINGAVQDITERRLADIALGKLRSELARVARLTSLGALTASVAHEVNQPLTGIITNAGTCLRMLAADPPNIDGARETVRRMIRDGNRASDVIIRLRSLFIKQSGAIESVDLNEAAREVIALSLTELQRHRVVVRDELDDRVPLVTGDRVQLQQVIMNLLLNAADAMSDIADRPRQVTIKTRCGEGDRVLLTVQDSGVGIDPQSVERLFEAFFTTKHGGMGIGLSISNSIIESHHGKLWATANDGPGATFSFYVPCEPAT